MLEQQDSTDCDYGATSTISQTKGNYQNVDDGVESEETGIRQNGLSLSSSDDPQADHGGEKNSGAVTTLSSSSSTGSTTTTTTTVRIHTTYKKRASKFMNRPNVQNGLGANSIIHPYGGTVASGIGGGGGSGFASGTKILTHSHQSPHLSSLYSGSTRNGSNHHRSLTTRSSLFSGGTGSVGGVGGGITSPQGTTASTTTTTESRPPFVTTVTRGRFLPSKFDLMVEKSLFTFSSRPKPVGLITRHQCSLSGGQLKDINDSQNCQPRGAHDYFNVMWDPHIYRGSTTTLTSSLKQPDTDLSSRDQERQRRRRAFLGGQNNVNYSNHDRNGNNNNPNHHLSPVGALPNGRNRYRMTTKVSSRSRTFPPPEGRHQVHVQTEDYLEDLSKDTNGKGPEVDAIVQTDPIEDADLISSSAFATRTTKSGKRVDRVLPKSGIDASTQVLPGELITFDERVQPIVEAVVGKILEQALLETMEEEEIGALKAQQNRFLEKRKEEERELKRLKEQQERISAEKERLKRHLEMGLRQQQQQAQSQNGDSDDAGLSSTSSILLGNEMGSNNNEMGMAGNNSNAMSTSYLLELLPSVINSLRQEGLLTDQIGDEVLTSFTPLWMRSSSNKDENDSDNPTTDRLEDDAVDDFDPFPDGYRSRVNSPDGAGVERKGSASKSPVLMEEDEGEKEEMEVDSATGGDDENDKLTMEEEVTIPEKEDDGEEKETTITPTPGDDNGDEGEGGVPEEQPKEAEEGSEETVVKEEDASLEINTTEDEVVEDDAPIESASSSLPSQLPNGAIPNIESRED